MDIKFYENRANGQSKGYALGVFASDTSVKNLMERLPQRKIQDQTLVVLPYTKQSLAKLEEATKRTDTVSYKVKNFSILIQLQTEMRLHSLVSS